MGGEKEGGRVQGVEGDKEGGGGAARASGRPASPTALKLKASTVDVSDFASVVLRCSSQAKLPVNSTPCTVAD